MRQLARQARRCFCDAPANRSPLVGALALDSINPRAQRTDGNSAFRGEFFAALSAAFELSNQNRCVERITARRLPAEVLTLYAELLEQLTIVAARRSIGHAQGSFVTKTIKGQTYDYFQHSVPGGMLKQTYLGRSGARRRRSLQTWRGARRNARVHRPREHAWCALHGWASPDRRCPRRARKPRDGLPACAWAVAQEAHDLSLHAVARRCSRPRATKICARQPS